MLFNIFNIFYCDVKLDEEKGWPFPAINLSYEHAPKIEFWKVVKDSNPDRCKKYLSLSLSEYLNFYNKLDEVTQLLIEGREDTIIFHTEKNEKNPLLSKNLAVRVWESCVDERMWVQIGPCYPINKLPMKGKAPRPYLKAGGITMPKDNWMQLKSICLSDAIIQRWEEIEYEWEVDINHCHQQKEDRLGARMSSVMRNKILNKLSK